MLKETLIISSTAAVFILSGCGSSDSSTTDMKTGYFVDSAVVNADYDCIADADFNKTTGINGEFQCQSMQQVRFRLGELVLGEISTLPTDGYVFPQDILGVERNNTANNKAVIAMAQLLQSLDSDHNTSNGIQIKEEVKTAFESTQFNADELSVYADIANIILIDKESAQNHLQETMQSHLHTHVEEFEPHTPDTNQTLETLSALTPELKEALAHMGNEERLAYDIYMNLYNYHYKQNDIEIKQLFNIAQNGEKTHVSAVQSLVQKYQLNVEDLNSVIDTSITSEYNMSSSITFEEMPSGVYDIPAIQELYDTLYEKGTASQQDALEVGCMVEVTDVTDLDEYIALAQESNASDIEQVFTNLRSGSYRHYWSFDRGLKNLGIEDGCCSLGSEWCHSEYPTNSHGQHN